VSVSVAQWTKPDGLRTLAGLGTLAGPRT